MRFANVLHALYCEPWFIRAEMHDTMRAILEAHITGGAHLPDGIVAQWEEKARIRETARVDPDKLTMEGSTAIVPLQGVIMKRASGFESMSGARDLISFEQEFRTADENSDVDSIVLHVDSPGGEVTGTPEAAAMVAEASTPVIAYTDGVMASAAYYIAAGADEIMATDSSTVGSIGVICSMLDATAAYEAAGIKPEIFKSGHFKGIGSDEMALDDDHREFLQDRVDDLFEGFARFVEDHRPVARAFMDGRYWSGGESQRIGLVDAIGGWPDVLNEAAALAAG